MVVVRLRVSVYVVVVRCESAQLGPRLCGQPIPVCLISVVRTVVSTSALLATVGEVGFGADAGVVCASLAHMPVTVVYQIGVKAAATGPYVAWWTLTDAAAVAPSAMEYSWVTGSLQTASSGVAVMLVTISARSAMTAASTPAPTSKKGTSTFKLAWAPTRRMAEKEAPSFPTVTGRNSNWPPFLMTRMLARFLQLPWFGLTP